MLYAVLRRDLCKSLAETGRPIIGFFNNRGKTRRGPGSEIQQWKWRLVIGFWTFLTVQTGDYGDRDEGKDQT